MECDVIGVDRNSHAKQVSAEFDWGDWKGGRKVNRVIDVNEGAQRFNLHEESSSNEESSRCCIHIKLYISL